VNYDHLEIPIQYQMDFVWEKAGEILKKIDMETTPKNKLKIFIQWSKVINDTITLASNKEEAAGADESIPLTIYVLLKSNPSMINTNIK
jgi:hypothetical protein